MATQLQLLIIRDMRDIGMVTPAVEAQLMGSEAEALRFLNQAWDAGMGFSAELVELAALPFNPIWDQFETIEDYIDDEDAEDAACQRLHAAYGPKLPF